MGRKTLGFGLLLIIVSAVIYYFNHAEHVKELKTLKEVLNVQLTQMKTNGFTVSDREIKKETEHFVIEINDPQKAALFLREKGMQFTVEELKELMGVQVKTDVGYDKDIIGLDLYPLTLPTYLTGIATSENDTMILAQIKDMIKEKTFFMHVDIVYSNTTFTGYIKDIDEKIEGAKEIKLKLQGLQFSGEIKEEKIVEYRQKFDTLHLYINNAINRTISGYESHYALTGTTVYDYTTDYKIEKINISEEADGTLFADTVVLHSTSIVKDGLATETLKTKIKNLDLLFEKEEFGMQSLDLEMNISNLHVDTLENLQKTDENKGKQIDTVVKKLASNTMHIDITNFLVDKVTLQSKEMNGFSLNGKLDIDDSLAIYRMGMKPKQALENMEGNITLSISKEILELMKKEPKFMLTYMMYRPKRVLEQRMYDIQINNGALKINGKLVEF
jgi:hypothetical protein